MIPSPQKAIRPCSLAISTTSRRLDPQPVSRPEGARCLRRQLLPAQQVPTSRAVLAAVGAGRGVTAPLGDEREAHLGERLQLADDPVAATVPAGTARAAPERVLHGPQRELQLERL